MKFSPAAYQINEYSRNGFRSYLDPARKKLLIATPEEEIRIKFLLFLIQELGVPLDKIITEVPLARFVKGAVGRTDILGLCFCHENECDFPLFLVECKAPTVPITDRVLNQALKYDSILQVHWIILTNGKETIAYQYDFTTNKFQSTESLPTYVQMIKGESLPFSKTPSVYDYKRPEFKEILSNNNLDNAKYFNWIGKGSAAENYSYILNLAGLLYDMNHSLSLPIITKWFEIIEEGYRYTTFGNAAGGEWT